MNFAPFSAWIQVRTRLTFLFIYSLEFSVLLWVYKSSFHYVCNRALYLAVGWNFHAFYTCQSTNSLSFLALLNSWTTVCTWDIFPQFYVKIKHTPNICPNVTNSLRRSVIHGSPTEFPQTSSPFKPSSSVSPHFTTEVLPSVASQLFLN